MPNDDTTIERQLQQAEELRAQYQFQDAASIYQSILEGNPDHAETLYQFGVMANMAGQHEVAADLISRAIDRAGDEGIRYVPELAPALALSGRQEEALGAFRRWTDALPNDPNGHYNKGNLLNGMGRPDEAAQSFRRAVALAPDFAEAQANLGATLHMTKRYDEAARAYRRAIRKLGDNSELHHNLGAVLRAQHKNDEAAAAYRKALAIKPDRLEVRENLAGALQDLGEYGEAAELFGAMLDQIPTSVDAIKGFAETLIAAGKADAAAARCDAFLGAHGYNSAVVACKAIALQELGESAEARRIMDFERFVRPIDVPVPDGYENIAAFNAAIEAEIRADESLDFEPLGRATAAGFQTDELLDGPTPAIALLARFIDDSVQDYIDQLLDDTGHPFVANAPRRWTKNGWGVILQSQGHQRPHIHPSGWLSGVYYVRVPDSIGDASQQGWIEFGRPPANVGCRADHPTTRVRPRPGKMLLFPSYFYHDTVPFEDEENRISFAFDIVPA